MAEADELLVRDGVRRTDGAGGKEAAKGKDVFL